MNVQYYDIAPPSGNANISFTIEDLISAVNDSSSSSSLPGGNSSANSSNVSINNGSTSQSGQLILGSADAMG